MTIGFNVVLALFILAPGFGVAMGLWAASPHKTFRPAAPPTTSTITLAVVAIGALLAHIAGATAFGAVGELLRAACDRGDVCWIDAEPNPYLVILEAGAETPNVNSLEIGWTLVALGLLTLAANLATRWVVGRGSFDRLLYGWMSELIRSSAPDNRYAVAYVLTALEKDEHYVGYQGLLDDVTLGPDKEVISVVLSEVSPFYVRLGPDKLERLYAEKETPIPQMHFAKDEIRNLAFEVVETEADEQDDDDAPMAVPTVH